MNSLSQTVLWIGLLAALTAGLIWQFVPIPDSKARLAELPLNGIGFQGQNLPLNEFEQQFFKGVGVIKRIYTVDNQPFFVTILDGTNNRHIVHDPYYCLKGSGWSLLDESSIKVEKGKANLVDLEKDGVKREAIYWFSNGKENYTSPLRYWWDTTLRRLTLGSSGPEPVLIMVQPLSKEPVDWDKFQKSFRDLFEI
jgi:hypothetical protein